MQNESELSVDVGLYGERETGEGEKKNEEDGDRDARQSSDHDLI